MYKGLPLKRIGDTDYFVHYLGWVWNSRIKKEVNKHDNGGGYLQVSLYDPKTTKSKLKYIHRLVAEAYLPNPENKRTVNHKDGNKGNNHVDNLEWATYKENIRHAIDVLGIEMGSGARSRGTDHYRCKLTESQVLEIRLENSLGRTHKDLANQYKISQMTVFKIVNRKAWKHI